MFDLERCSVLLISSTFLTSSINSLSDIVLDNVKLPAESEAKIVPFLERIKESYGNPQAIETLQESIENAALPPEAFGSAPPVNAYALIQWALQGKSEGHGYGFPFDRPHLAFAKRLRRLNEDIERIQNLHLRSRWQDNSPYFKIHTALKPIMKDRALWKAVAALEEKAIPFEKLRSAMRIAPATGRNGLNDEGRKENIRTIEARVEKFRAWMIRRKNHAQDPAAGKMIAQIDKYWEKLFADPIRSLKRSHRRRTGNASSRRMLRTILAETPLVKNLENAAYMKILLKEKASLEAIFAEIEIDTFREAFKQAQHAPERIPSKIKALIAMADFPEKLVTMIQKAAT